jgi:hypothetical protein
MPGMPEMRPWYQLVNPAVAVAFGTHIAIVMIALAAIAGTMGSWILPLVLLAIISLGWTVVIKVYIEAKVDEENRRVNPPAPPKAGGFVRPATVAGETTEGNNN